MWIPASLHACGAVFPLAIATSICLSSVTICSALYFLIDISSFLLREILSHFNWYKKGRSGQPGALWCPFAGACQSPLPWWNDALFAAVGGGCSGYSTEPTKALTFTYDFDRGPQGFSAGLCRLSAR